MDRVRRTLCFATKTIAVSAFFLTANLVNAQQIHLPGAVIHGHSPARILQAAAKGFVQSQKLGYTQLLAIATTQGSSNSGGLLGSIFGVTGESSTKPTPKPANAPSKVPMPPTLRSGSVSSAAPPASLQPTTQKSKANWAGVPYHSPTPSSRQTASVPLTDPDPSKILAVEPRRLTPSVEPGASTRIPSPPTAPIVSQPKQLRTVSKTLVQPPADPATPESSSRRSSRRTAASMAVANTSGQKDRSQKELQTRESLERVVDLVPKVSRKTPSNSISKTSSNTDPEKVTGESKGKSNSLVKKNNDLQPLPPASLSAESTDDVQEPAVASEPAAPMGGAKKIEATAVSHRKKKAPTATTNEKTSSVPTSGQTDLTESKTLVEANNVATPAALSEQPAEGTGRLPAASEPLANANDLRGQPLTITGGSAEIGHAESMQLSPPTTPDFEAVAKSEDSSNSMRGKPKSADKIAGTTSELPGIRVTTRGPNSILIRQDAEYEIIIENRGEIDTDGILIRALVPEWADLRGQVASRGEIGNLKEGNAERLVWRIGKLPAGSAETMKLRLTASRSGNYDLDVDWTLVPQKSVARVQVREPRLNLTIEGPDQVIFGQSQTYKVRVLNPGNGTASNVTFTLSPNSATPQTQRIGDIPPGKEAQFDIELTAKDHGDLKIHGLAAGDLTLRAEAEKTISVAAAKLEAVLSGPQVKYQNTEGLYSLQVQNHGDAASDQVQASLRLPSGVKYLGGIEGAIQEEQTLRWDLEQLAPGAVLTYQFQCNMDTTGEHLFTFDCRGTAAGAAAVSISTRVESIADLVLTVSDPVAPAPIGTDVPYEITIRNRGSKEATDVRAIAQFSHGVEPQRIEGQSGEVMTGQVLFDSIPRIAAGEEIRLRVIARADRPGHHRFRTEIRSGDTVLVAEEATHYMSPEGERVSRRSSERLRR